MLEKLQPFNLNDVPADLADCVYEEERKRGSVLCLPTAYKVVLALRWILRYTEEDYYSLDEYESWRVYWKTEDDYGFRTQIILCRDEHESYDSCEDEWYVAQKSCFTTLATLNCHEIGVIRSVRVPGAAPYGGWAELDARPGIYRLLEDAAYGARATHNSPLSIDGSKTWVQRSDWGGALELGVATVEKPQSVGVIDIELEVRRPWWAMRYDD